MHAWNKQTLTINLEPGLNDTNRFILFFVGNCCSVSFPGRATAAATDAVVVCVASVKRTKYDKNMAKHNVGQLFIVILKRNQKKN